tara:strand:+ start:185 stop:370 length:186 start_codon:yes stop_codon:yes gene_type:complete
MQKQITNEMLDAFLGDATNKQARINLIDECNNDEQVKQDVWDYWRELHFSWQVQSTRNKNQ